MLELDGWQELCGKLLLVADKGSWCATEMNPQRKSLLDGHGERGRNNEETVEMLMEAKLVCRDSLVWIC